MTNSSSELQLQVIREENERVQHRIDELHKILSDDTTSIVQRSKAKVELCLLQKDHHSTTLQRASVTALTKGRNSGHVSKNKAKLEQDVKRNKERLRHEEDILQIQQELQCDCLLYTSPSPRDATLSRMPSSA